MDPACSSLPSSLFPPPLEVRGLGRKLVDACLAFARERKAHRLVLVSNTRLRPALRLYEAFGFQHRTPPSPLPYSTADVYMELDLDDAG